MRLLRFDVKLSVFDVKNHGTNKYVECIFHVQGLLFFEFSIYSCCLIAFHSFLTVVFVKPQVLRGIRS